MTSILVTLQHIYSLSCSSFLFYKHFKTRITKATLHYFEEANPNSSIYLVYFLPSVEVEYQSGLLSCKKQIFQKT